MWSLQRSKYHISHHLSIDAIRHHSSTAVINFVYDIAQIKATIADSLLRQWVFAWRLWLRFRCVNDELWIMHTAWPIANLLICQHFRCRIGIAGLAAATTGWNRWDRLQFECWFVVPQFLFGNVNDFFDIRTIEWQFVEAILQILLWHNDTGAKGCFVGKTLANCIGRVFSVNIKLNQYYLQKCFVMSGINLYYLVSQLELSTVTTESESSDHSTVWTDWPHLQLPPYLVHPQDLPQPQDFDFEGTYTTVDDSCNLKWMFSMTIDVQWKESCVKCQQKKTTLWVF